MSPPHVPLDPMTAMQMAARANLDAQLGDEKPPPDWEVKHKPLARCRCGHFYLGHEFRTGLEFRLNPCDACGCGYFEPIKMPSWLQGVFVDDVEMAAWRDVDNLARGRAFLADVGGLSPTDIAQAHRDKADREAATVWNTAGDRVAASSEPAAAPQVAEDDDMVTFG